MNLIARFRRHFLACVAGAGVALACASETGPDTAEAAPAELLREPVASRPRRMVEVRWDTLWAVGGDEQDTLLLGPNGFMAVDGERLYVSDAQRPRIVAFHRRDGSLAWMAGGKGAGPGEFRHPRSLSVTRSGELVVLDPVNVRLSILGTDGRLQREVPLGETPDPHSVCPLADGSFLLSTGYRDRSLLRISPAGAEVGRFALPWRGLDSLPALPRTATLASHPSGDGCLVALTKGRGFASIDTTGSHGQTHAYVEWFDLQLPVVKKEVVDGMRSTLEILPERRIAAASTAVDGGEVVFAFEGLTKQAGRYLDVYDRESGEYRHTLLVPNAVRGVARADGVYYLLTSQHGFPQLLALRPRPAA